jgi:hypothetical protein
MVTIHADGSFRFLESDDGFTGLEILNPTEFWKSSRFLVVITK